MYVQSCSIILSSESIGADVFFSNAQKMKFSVKDFFNKCEQSLSFLQILWSGLMCSEGVAKLVVRGSAYFQKISKWKEKSILVT